LRDFRQFFQAKFELYLQEKFNLEECFSKKTLTNQITFQFYLLGFTVHIFDEKMIETMATGSNTTPVNLYKRLALFIGSFLMPKFVNKGLQNDYGKKYVLKDPETGRFSLTNKTSSLINNLE